MCRLFDKSAIFRAIADVIGYSSSEHNSFPQIFCFVYKFATSIRLSFCCTISPCDWILTVTSKTHATIYTTVYFHTKSNVLHTKILLSFAHINGLFSATNTSQATIETIPFSYKKETLHVLSKNCVHMKLSWYFVQLCYHYLCS